MTSAIICPVALAVVPVCAFTQVPVTINVAARQKKYFLSLLLSMADNSLIFNYN
jgi:hypothetical protein